MKAEILIAGLSALPLLPLCLATSRSCVCNGIINSKGQGECQTTYRGKPFCYVNKGHCEDAKKGTSSNRYWSYQACENYSMDGPECYSLKGERCQFPFKWDNRIFNNCTTYKSVNGAAWCATRVRGQDRQAARGSLEDCSSPCDYGASPYEDCPRSPVVKGLSRDCCTPDKPCRVGEGDCDNDNDCGKGLKCGRSNCAQFRPDNYARADCCYDPEYSYTGKASCWFDGRKRKDGETFPAKDKCNDCVCNNGEVACTEMACTDGYSDGRCSTVGGADSGAKCVFPFTFDGKRYSDCTTTGSYDGKAWCSTKVDNEGRHIGGKGNWGHCPAGGCSSNNGGSWSSWGSWSSCSASCGGGERTRRRTCSGGNCLGPASESLRCFLKSCCDCGSWSSWGRCEGPCGGRGTQSRSRTCWQGTCSTQESRSCSTEPCTGPLFCANGTRLRKNVNSLNAEERRNLVSALQSSIRRGEYQKVGNYHGAPRNLCVGRNCCPHNSIGFLPWHRLYMVHMEEELGEALPYWDWTEDGNVPPLWEGIRAPIQRGEVGRCSGNGFTSRDPRAQVNPARLKAGVRAALMEETFEGFSRQIGNPHDDLHISMGCDMFQIETASYDPLFYLHHTYVDYVFAYWQELQRLRGHDVVPRVRGLGNAFAPFNNRRFNNKQVTLRNNRGRDTFSYTENYCYEYQDLQFNGQTPLEFYSSTAFGPEDSSVRERMVIFVGVVTRKMMPSGFTTFDLCSGGTCVEAGRLASFGSRDANTSPTQEVDSDTHKLTEFDVTDLMDEQGWNVDEDLQAMLTTSLVEGLPQPVIISKFGQVKEVKLPKGQTLEDYGDLLDEYSIVDDIA